MRRSLTVVQVLQIDHLLDGTVSVLLAFDNVSSLANVMAHREFLNALLRVSYKIARLLDAAGTLLHLRRLLVDLGLSVGIRVSHDGRRGEDLSARVGVNDVGVHVAEIAHHLVHERERIAHVSIEGAVEQGAVAERIEVVTQRDLVVVVVVALAAVGVVSLVGAWWSERIGHEIAHHGVDLIVETTARERDRETVRIRR